MGRTREMLKHCAELLKTFANQARFSTLSTEFSTTRWKAWKTVLGKILSFDSEKTTMCIMEKKKHVGFD